MAESYSEAFLTLGAPTPVALWMERALNHGRGARFELLEDDGAGKEAASLNLCVEIAPGQWVVNPDGLKRWVDMRRIEAFRAASTILAPPVVLEVSLDGQD